MGTYIDLQNEVNTLLIDTPQAVQTLVPKFVNRAIRKLQVKHNFKVMESNVVGTTTFGSRVIVARPTDWKSPRGNPYYIQEIGKPREIYWISSEAEAVARYGNNVDLDYGDPRALFEDDLSAEFNAYPYPDGLSDYADGEYRLIIPYWKYLGLLIADNDTNWFTDNAEQWVIYQSVAEGFYANEDEARAEKWEIRAAKEYKDVVAVDKDRRISETTSLVPHLGAKRPHTQE